VSETPASLDASESPIRLETPADCERALAKFIKQIHKGSLDHKIGHSLIIGIGTLAKLMRERRDDEAMDKLAELERKRAPHPSPPTPQAH
jgi:hypothetical protein